MAYEYTTITIDLTGQGGTGTDGTLYAELFATVTLANNDTVPPRKFSATVTSGAGSIVLPCTATAIKGTNAPFKVTFVPTNGAEVTLGRIVSTESATAVQLSDLLEVGATSAQPVTTYNVDATTLTIAPSIAQLQAMRGLTDGLRVLVQDIGIYRYAAASAADADETTVITPATAVGRWLREIAGAESLSWINVKDYGAAGDGNTDDTAAIQVALDAAELAGGAILLPPGIYKTSGGAQAGSTAIAINGGSNITVVGYGATIHAGSNTARVLGIFGSSNVHIRGLKIVGYTGVLDPTTENHALIAISNSSNVTVEDCYLTNSLGDCIYIGGDITNGASLGYTSKNIWVTRNVLKSRYGNGVASSSSGSMSRMAVAATDCDGLSITDNTIYGKIDFEPNANYQGVRFGLVQGNRCLAGPVRPQAVIGSDYWHDEPVTDPSGLASPTAAPTLGTATTGGTIPAGTYYACITYYLGSNETARSPESASITTTGSASTITVTGGAIPAGATGVKVYLTPATESPGTETYAALYTSGTSVVVTALPSTAAAWPPSELINHIDVTGPAGTSDSDFNVFQNNVVENGILSCSNVYRANIAGNLLKKGHISIGASSGGGTSNVVVQGNVVRAPYAGKTSAIKAENFSSCVFSGNVLESGTSAYLFEVATSNGGSTFSGNTLTDTAASGLFTGSLHATDVAIANSRSPATGTARPNSTAQSGEAWIHNVAEVTLTTTSQVIDWNTVRADFWNLSGNGQSLARVQNIPDGTILTVRSGAFGGSSVTVEYSSSYIRTANSANWVSFVGGENITFYAYSGILWEVCRSTAAPLTATADLNFASIAAGATAELTITVPGAASTNAVVLGPPAGLEAGLMATGRVSAADTVTIRLHNTTAGAIDPADATWRATVLR